jgi:ATP-dependent helicase HrpB
MREEEVIAFLRSGWARNHVTAITVAIPQPYNPLMSFSVANPQFPVDAIADELGTAMTRHNRAVLIAPPGAGKTTRVPLALLAAEFVGDRRIVVVEPRRLAARAAAQYMAKGLGQSVGQTIGLRVRLQSLVSQRTRVELLTEGVFTRMILADPQLSGIAAVIFDEFHERSLDADLGLALCLDTQSAWREDLRILVMSATIDGARVARLMGEGAPIIRSEGRMFPVETRYLGRDSALCMEEELAQVALRLVREQHGSMLIFLPGQREIRRVAELLGDSIIDPAIDIVPLYGALDPVRQNDAVRPAAPGHRKIVLATSIAETSLTIDGVRIVLDCGLARRPRFEPDHGLTRLETVRVSRAAADQRCGRAGRSEPGLCYRLWEKATALEPFARPEILAADLSGFVLDLAQWGVIDPQALAFLDPPPTPAIAEARRLLADLGALDASFRITAEGRAMRRLALPPRLARMVIAAARHNRATARLAATVATILVEPGIGGAAVDIEERLEHAAEDRSPRGSDARQLVDNLVRQAGPSPPSGAIALTPGSLIGLAFPDRIARQRGRAGEFLLASGRAAAVEPFDRLAGETFLAVAELSGRAAASRILAAARLSLTEIDTIAGTRIEQRHELRFDAAAVALRARQTRRLGAIILLEQPLPAAEHPEAAQALAEGIAAVGLDRLPWTKTLRQWRDRVMFLRHADPDAWPDLSDEALRRTAREWLAPFLIGKGELAALTPVELEQALHAQLSWQQARQLEVVAPTHFLAPSGSRIAIDYTLPEAPTLAVRVQELFGLSQHPSLADGRVPLALHLLSPAQRTIQITRDLPGFWTGSWGEARAAMKGRYPRHHWPEDPARAVPTNRARARRE